MSTNCAEPTNDTAVEDLPDRRIPRSTEWHRKKGRPTRQQKAEKQRYITAEENAVLCTEVAILLGSGLAALSERVRSRAFEIKRQRLEALGQSQAMQMVRPPSKNWPDGFLERHKRELQIEKLRGIGWRPKASPWGEEIADFAASLSDTEHLCSECAKI
jgi:hypothetical protein